MWILGLKGLNKKVASSRLSDSWDDALSVRHAKIYARVLGKMGSAALPLSSLLPSVYFRVFAFSISPTRLSRSLERASK